MLRAGWKNRLASRANSLRRKFLHLEELESRRVLAGNVSASVSDGNLSIAGDDASNQILVTRNADLSVTITSLDGTTINGQAGPITLANARDDLAVNMAGGDDVIRFAGSVDLLFRMYGNANIVLGSGNDELGMSNFSVWRDLAVNAGSGNDRIIGTRDYIGGSPSAGWGLRVGETTVINTEDGNDEVRLKDGEFMNVFTVNTGSNDDLLSICQSRFRDALVLSGGVGGDDLYSNGNTFEGRVSMSGWELADNTSCGPPINPGPTPSNQAPVAANDAATLLEGANSVINVAANDSDADGNLNLGSIQIMQLPTNGTVSVNANGTVTYTHNGSDTTGDSFSYRISDSQGAVSNVASVTLTITPVNDTNLPPVANADTATLSQAGSTVINVASNDTDPEGALNPASIVITQQPTGGTVTVNANGTVTYNHSGGSGTSDTFQYTIRDAAGNVSNAAQVTLTVTPVGGNPVAANDSATVNEGGTQIITVAANDSDPAGTLDLASIVITQQPTFGTLTVNNNGTVTYLHNGSETTTDSFRYTIKDTQGNTSNAALVNVTITPVSDTPTAVNDAATVAEAGSVTINVATNDTDAEGQIDLTSIVITQQPTRGTVTVNPNGTVVYQHNGSETTSDSFSYTIEDAQGNVSNAATVNITVTPVTEAPLAVNDTATVNEGGTQTINLAANDSDAEGTLDLTSIVITQQPTSGTLTVNSDGTVTYVHNGSETTTDSFRYTIEDAGGTASNEATVNLTITPVSDTPVANADTATVNEGESVVVDLAGNDTDAEGTLNLTTIDITQDPLNGTITVNQNGTVTYTHDGSETTSDTFRYTIKDAQGNTSAEGTVTVTITPVSDDPVAVADNGAVDEGGSQTIDVAANDTDAEGQLNDTSTAIVQQPANGTATVNPDGTVTYVHNGSETTTDSFTYTIADAQGNISNAATVSIAVSLLNSPVATDDTASVTENTSTPATGNVLTNDTDADGPSPLAVSAVGGSAASVGTNVPGTYGTFNIAADGTFTYTLDEADPDLATLDDLEELIDSIAYSVSDGADEDTAQLTVTINGATD